MSEPAIGGDLLDELQPELDDRDLDDAFAAATTWMAATGGPLE